jgi:glycosyltransferase involved in cell wall biosynthesis
MNIMMLAPEFLPVWGGVGTYIVEMARHLKDIELHILTPSRTGFGNEKLETDYDLEEIFPENVHIHFVSKASDTFLYNAKFQYACFKNAPHIIKENKIDIIHSHTAHMPDILLNLRKLDIPTITTVHTTIKGQRNGTSNSGAGFFDLESSEKMTYLMYPFLRIMEEHYFKENNSYIVVSDWMKNQIIEEQHLNSNDVSVVHNGVNPNTFDPKKAKDAEELFPQLFEIDKPKILFSSRFVERKGARFLLNAIPNILKNVDAHFIFAGTGKINLNIPSENYTFLNYVDYLKMPYLYCSSDMFILTSLYENFPLTVLEAMSSGLGVISTDVGGVPELINPENGILIPKGDVSAITENIINLVENDQLRNNLGTNARKTIEKKFTWDLAAKKTRMVYEQALET